MDDQRYKAHQKEQFRKFEGLCRCCGECCGSQDGEACANLALDQATGRYYCKDYENRLGPQKTTGGRYFNCVLIRDIAKHRHLRPNCAYNKIL